MKKPLIFLALSSAWILFSGLIWIGLQPLPSLPPQVSSPLAVRASISSPVETEKPSSLISQLERNWKTERLLQTAA